MPAGSRLAAGKVLRPYASPSLIKGVLDGKEGRKLYPHFYPGRRILRISYG